VSAPGHRQLGEDLAPGFTLIVGKTELQTDLSQYIKSVEFENAIDMADMIALTVINPNFMFTPDAVDAPPMRDAVAHRAFQPGNEAELRGGYGPKSNHVFIGKAILAKHIPSFPKDGMPTLQVKGYSRSFLMMNASGDLNAQDDKVQLAQPRQAGKNDTQGELYIDMTSSQIVTKVAAKYGFATDIDPTDHKHTNRNAEGIIQKKGTSDYKLVQTLANMERRDFYVDFDPKQKRWVLHWKKPKDTATPELVFTYGTSNASLLSFETEYGIKDTINELVVHAYDPAKQQWISIVQIEDLEGPDPLLREGGGRIDRNSTAAVQDPGVPKKASPKAKAQKQHEVAVRSKEIKHALSSATEFRLAAGGVAIDIVAERPFQDLAEAARFARRWFLARRDHFMVAKGHIIGIETLRAGQVHRFQGLGSRLNGDYYFIATRHKFSADGVYVTEYTARKVIS
jgi:phage protein D